MYKINLHFLYPSQIINFIELLHKLPLTNATWHVACFGTFCCSERRFNMKYIVESSRCRTGTKNTSRPLQLMVNSKHNANSNSRKPELYLYQGYKNTGARSHGRIHSVRWLLIFVCLQSWNLLNLIPSTLRILGWYLDIFKRLCSLSLYNI